MRTLEQTELMIGRSSTDCTDACLGPGRPRCVWRMQPSKCAGGSPGGRRCISRFGLPISGVDIVSVISAARNACTEGLLLTERQVFPGQSTTQLHFPVGGPSKCAGRYWRSRSVSVCRSPLPIIRSGCRRSRHGLRDRQVLEPRQVMVQWLYIRSGHGSLSPILWDS
mgnify:CR=1 FL=1